MAEKIKHVVADLDKIRKKLGHYTPHEAHVQFWLDTKHPRLHRVLGSESRGIAYGKLIEISGNESACKTALAQIICRHAQEDGGGRGGRS